MNDPAGYDDCFQNDDEYKLIKAIGAGNVHAFEKLIKKYQNPVLNFIYRYMGDAFGAEDIAQEVFLRVYRAASEFEPRGKVSTWIFKIAYNLSVNEILRMRRFCRIEETGELRLETAEPKDLGLKELEQEMIKSIARLPEKQRAVLLLRVNEELSYAEIGRILSISISSVESLLFRARGNLKRILRADSKEQKE